ncbi:MAG: segregation/condensation protein A [Endomicrobium sp.]|nr:segregation/condensation protein A [Endomicrobium sp.]
MKINNIKIAEITFEYFIYLNLIQTLNIDIKGKFVVIESTLMRIKAKSILPSNNKKEVKEKNTFDQLKSKLVEYQK